MKKFRKMSFILSLLVLLFTSHLEANALTWKDLWQRRDQQAASQFKSGKVKAASQLFTNRPWRAAAHYRAGQYQQALANLKGFQSADAYYNRGNTLAKMGKIDDAIKQYTQALKLNPDHKDAAYNLALLKKLKHKQQNVSAQPRHQQNQTTQPEHKKNNTTQSQANEKKHSESSKTNQRESSETNSRNKPKANNQATKTHKKSSSSKNRALNKPPENRDQKASQKAPPQSEQPRRFNQAHQEKQHKQKSTRGAGQTSQVNTKDQPPAQQAEARQHTTPGKIPDRETQQVLQKVPDDPGGLLRQKFLRDYLRRQQQGNRP